jgi:hypothetical protein
MSKNTEVRKKRRELKKYERKRWRHFYYNGKAHKMLALHRGRDEVLAWCYKEHDKKIYSWIDVKRNGSPAMFRSEVARIVRRDPRTIEGLIYKAKIRKPERTYSLETGRPGPFLYSKQDVYDIYEYIRQTHRGRPRQDGFTTNWHVPDKQEIRAAADSGLFIYARNELGEYVPIWKAEEF